MKKTFSLTSAKIPVPRRVEAIKFEIKKYIKRERRKTLPPNVDFWDFDCRFGEDATNSKEIHLTEINKYISQAETNQRESFYLEILVKPGLRSHMPKQVQQEEEGEE